MCYVCVHAYSLGGRGRDFLREIGLFGSESDLCLGPDLLPRELNSLTATSLSIKPVAIPSHDSIPIPCWSAFDSHSEVALAAPGFIT